MGSGGIKQALLIRPMAELANAVVAQGVPPSTVVDTGVVSGQDELVTLLGSQGVAVKHLPVMEIVPLALPFEGVGNASRGHQKGQPDTEKKTHYHRIKSLVMDVDHYQHAIFVSRNAAALAAGWLDYYWPMLPTGINYYAVGDKTGRALHSLGLHVGREVQIPLQRMDSEGLLQLPSLSDVQGEKVVIFAGQGGRALLADTLNSRGAEVDRCELYQRKLQARYQREIKTLVKEGRVDSLLVHSGELLNNIITLMGEDWEQLLPLPIVVPGPRLAAIADKKGFLQVVEAVSASGSSMAEALLEW